MNDNTAESSEQQKWYDKKWIIILLLLIFFPVGFYALYKNRTFGTKEKWSITGVFALLLVVGIATGPQKKSGSVSSDTTESTTSSGHNDKESSIPEHKKASCNADDAGEFVRESYGENQHFQGWRQKLGTGGCRFYLETLIVNSRGEMFEHSIVVDGSSGRWKLVDQEITK